MNGTLRVVTMVGLGAFLLLASTGPVLAQQAGSRAEMKSVIGRVEVLQKGQTQWIPAVIGAQLAEGDDVRTYAGASAELALPDTSTVVLTENSRMLLSKMEFDTQNRSRFVLLHLAVGKVRATIAQAAVALTRARQSNFAISTSTAVAAARGTIMWVFTDGDKSMMAVEPEFGVTEGISTGAWRK
jgi:hypothetical protein